MENITKFIHNNHLAIIVKPNAGKTEVLGYDESKNALKVGVAAPADKNKANVELIKFFSKLLKKKVLIKSGLTSKEKVLLVKD